MVKTPNKYLEQPAHGSYVDDWDSPINANWTIVDNALGGIAALTTTAGDTTLSTAQYQNLILQITGTLTANVNYVIPSTVQGQWTYDTTGLVLGAFSLHILSDGGGATVDVSANTQGIVYSDGTNIRSSTPPSLITSPEGSSGDIQYNNGGVFGGTSSIALSGTTTTITRLNLTDALQVQHGGSGAATFPVGYALLGNGTGALGSVAPGTSGNVLTSNGSTWASAATVSSFNTRTGAVTLNTDDIKIANAPMPWSDLGSYSLSVPPVAVALNVNYPYTDVGFTAGEWKCMGIASAFGTTIALFLRIA